MGERTTWRPFLEQWSAEWIAGHDPDKDAPLAQEVVRDAWLGFAPASEAEVAAAEARLGRRLPPSLREFLLVTNGWRDAGNFIYRLAGAAELEWLRDTDDRTWIEVWEDLAEDDVEEDEDGEEAFGVQEAKVLARCLRLSLEGDAAVMLLDPDDVDVDGEWAAYWLASWSGEGPERYGSFRGLMRRQWVSFHALRKPPGATRDHWDAEVERARCEALAGAVDGPLSVFAQAHEYGRERADVLSMQMKAMLGDWRGHIASLMWCRPGNDDLLLSPLFAAELLPLLVRQDQLAHPHDLRPLPRLKEHAPAPVRALVADYEARAAEPGFRLTFGGPEFDAAVHAVADRLAGQPAFQAPDEPPIRTGPIVVTLYAGGGPRPEPDPMSDPAKVRTARAGLCDEAWPELRAALRLWHPVCEDHIAPISLFADPVLAQLITPDRGREILATPRGTGPGVP
ncbi:SMI1/KNR4 family protein SUKH-1 [Streptomyces sp. Ag82_O1-15]|uniref:SMI1/KNR4 family protein n=1 Tax=Streptomyces sp. Ag82_O1-15 TaxID=1938855 RepID=UPI000BB0E1DE|nr:SMI1/KNR4 family protein [Streptomyces sp. Ag82_O1-15]PBD00824.1 SMI1/KNR4 family protein SUKH-1 [Streptomyces sp. Ag82_O1-15]